MSSIEFCLQHSFGLMVVLMPSCGIPFISSFLWGQFRGGFRFWQLSKAVGIAIGFSLLATLSKLLPTFLHSQNLKHQKLLHYPGT